MDELLLHPLTKSAIVHAITGNTHAILLSAPQGAGKLHTATVLTANVLQETKIVLAEHPAVMYISPEKLSISIEQIRLMQSFLKLKTTGTARIRRVVVIEAAHTMTIEAQNALLKALEEPPADTLLILMAVPDGKLLPTIYSRVQTILLRAPDEAEVAAHFKDRGYTDAQIKRAYQIADGQVGLLAALLAEDNNHPMVAAIEQAKRIITQSSFERLLLVDELSKQKDNLSDLLLALKRVYRSVLLASSNKGTRADVERLIRNLRAVQATEAALARNASPKLALTDLFLHL